MSNPLVPGLVVAADHPSLDGAVAAFADELRREPRFFGPSMANPKPFPSLVDGLARRDGGFRVAAIHDGRVIGMARIDDAGDVLVAVVVDARGRGVGTELLRAAVERARGRGYGRLRLRASRRSRAALALGDSMGFLVVDQGRGRIDLILELAYAATSA